MGMGFWLEQAEAVSAGGDP